MLEGAVLQPGYYKRKIYAFAGGKGGVGKSLVTANIAIGLARMGHKVVAVDLDFGGANLHTHMGVTPPRATLTDYLSGKIKDINEVASQTYIPNLSMICGSKDHLEVGNSGKREVGRLLARLKTLRADFILLDLGAGTTFSTLDLFIEADHKIMIVTPEPTSLENAHRFIKSAFVRRFRRARQLIEVGALVREIFESKTMITKSPAHLIQNIAKSDPVLGRQLYEEMRKFHPLIIMNQIREEADCTISKNIEFLYRRHLGIESTALGHLTFDTTVWQSIRKCRSVLEEYPASDFAFRVKEIARVLSRAA